MRIKIKLSHLFSVSCSLRSLCSHTHSARFARTLTPLARLTPRSLTPTLPLVARALKRCRFAPISARSFWSHAGMLARLFATLALAPSMDQSTINIIENAYEKKCLRHPRLRLDVACRSLCSRLLAHSLCSHTRFARTLARTSWTGMHSVDAYKTASGWSSYADKITAII